MRSQGAMRVSWTQPDVSSTRVRMRGGRQEFLFSRVMCWVALDRAIRLATKRSSSPPCCATRKPWGAGSCSSPGQPLCSPTEERGDFRGEGFASAPLRARTPDMITPISSSAVSVSRSRLGELARSYARMMLRKCHGLIALSSWRRRSSPFAYTENGSSTAWNAGSVDAEIHAGAGPPNAGVFRGGGDTTRLGPARARLSAPSRYTGVSPVAQYSRSARFGCVVSRPDRTARPRSGMNSSHPSQRPPGCCLPHARALRFADWMPPRASQTSLALLPCSSPLEQQYPLVQHVASPSSEPLSPTAEC